MKSKEKKKNETDVHFEKFHTKKNIYLKKIFLQRTNPHGSPRENRVIQSIKYCCGKSGFLKLAA